MTAGTPDEPYARVTLGHVYGVLLSVQGTLAAVQQSVAVLANQREHDAEDIREIKEKYGRRLETLEEGRWPLRQIAALGTVATVAVAVVGVVITLAVKNL